MPSPRSRRSRRAAAALAVLMLAAPATTLGAEDPVTDAGLRGDWRAVAAALEQSAPTERRAEHHFLLGHALIALNRNDEAFALLWTAGSEPALTEWQQWTSALVRAHSDAAIAHFLHGDALARRGHWSDAIAALDVAIGLQPDLVLARTTRGVVYAARREPDRALDDLAAAAAQGPNFVATHLNLGSYWVHQRAPEGAIAAFDAALAIAPSALALNGRGCAHYGRGEWEAATRDLAAAGKRSQFPFLLHNLRTITVAADAIGSPDLDTSPRFRLSDFLDWERFRVTAATAAEPLHAFVGRQTLPPIPNAEVLTLLNRKLEDPTFHDRHQGVFDLTAAPAVRELVTRSAPIRKAGAATPAEPDREMLVELNRFLLELSYPDLIAAHTARAPGMQVTNKTGLVNPFDLNAQVTWKQNLPTQRLESALGKMQWQKPLADVTIIAGTLARNPYVISAGAGWRGMLDVGIKSSETVLATRSQQLGASTQHPGGVVVDLRRAHVDDGEWNVEVPFELAYGTPAPWSESDPR